MCGVLNLPPPPTFLAYLDKLRSCAEGVCFESMRNAIEHAVELNEGVREIPAAFDGTWQKQGYTSLIGVVTATSFDSGRVIDVAILSKYCKCPNKITDEHLASCTSNYRGPSGGMEVEQYFKQIFCRSLQLYNLRYTL